MGWKSKRTVMQRYDLTANMYDERYSEEQKTKYKAALKNLDLAGGVVIDVGCGSGLSFGYVSTQASVVVGIDVSRKLLRKAKEQARAYGNTFVLQADADHLPFRDGFFDFVFAFTVLQNMPQPAETLDELKRATKANGKVVVTGLKKAIPLEKFAGQLEKSGMNLVSFLDSDELKCYISVLVR